MLPVAASSSTQLQDRELEPSLGSLAALAAANDVLCQTKPKLAELAEVPDGVSAASLSAVLL